ncbi:MAG: hypothetical protein R8P61_13495 [Bacteroidia bacterium]|nr:hypothetical protein [Bacteroidia bacterium]
MYAKQILVLGFLCLLFNMHMEPLVAQTEETEGGISLLSDTSLFIAGSSLTLLRKNAIELNVLTSLSSFQLGVREARETSPYADLSRLTDFSSRMDAYLGMSRNGRFDLGFRLEYRRRRLDNAARSSVGEVFNEYNPQQGLWDNSFGGISRAGLRFRLKPLAKNQKFTVFGGYSAAVLKSEEFQDGLAVTADRLDLNLAYFTPLNNRVYYFFSVNGFTDLENREDSLANYQAGANFALIHTSINRRFTVYPGLNYSINAEPVNELSGKSGLAWTSQQFAAFLGIQLQFNSRFLLNTTASFPISSRFSSPWLGIVPRSTSSISLGLRILI